MNSFFLQDSSSSSSFMITSFHNHCLVILLMVVTLVSFVSVGMMIFGSKGFYSRTLSGSEPLEIFWTVIPCLVLTSLALPSLEALYMLEEVCLPMVTVKVTGHQWYWSYEISSESTMESFDSYILPSQELGEGGLRLLETDNEIILPLGKEVRLVVTSSDVIHSWSMPSMGVKIDAIPGRLNSVGFIPNKSGVYFGQCSEICGSLHSFMPIKMVVLDDKDLNSSLN